MKTLKILITSLVLILLFSCHRDDIAPQKPIVITVSAGLKSENPQTRAWFGKSDDNIKNTPNITALWEDGDASNMHIAIKQGNQVRKATNIKILKILDGNKKIIFSFELPPGMDISAAATIYGALGHNISLDASNPNQIVLPTSGNELKDRLVLSFKEEVSKLGDLINVKFSHIYSVLCLRLQNSTGGKYAFPDGSNKLKFISTEKWAMSGSKYDMETGEIFDGIESKEVEFFTVPNAYIVDKDIKEYWAVVSPKAGMTNNPILKLKQGLEQIAIIDDELAQRAKPLERAKTYYIAGKLSKEGESTKLEFIKNSELDETEIMPYIVLKSNSDKLSIYITAQFPANAWIDLNNNGEADRPAENIENRKTKEYTINNTDRTATIYGALYNLNITSTNLVSLDASKGDLEKLFVSFNNFLTSLNVNGAKSLWRLYCYNNNAITSLNTNGIPTLKELACYRNSSLSSLIAIKNKELTVLHAHTQPKLSYLDVSNNEKLITLSSYNTALSSLDVSTNPKLKWLKCSSSKITSLDVTKNTELLELDCSGNTDITKLDLSKNTKLTSLGTRGCPIEDLDLSTNLDLIKINIAASNLKTIDLSNHTKLVTSIIQSNPKLQSINVVGCTSLKELYINQNPELNVPIDVSDAGRNLTTFWWQNTPKLNSAIISQEQNDNRPSDWKKDEGAYYEVR